MKCSACGRTEGRCPLGAPDCPAASEPYTTRDALWCLLLVVVLVLGGALAGCGTAAPVKPLRVLIKCEAPGNLYFKFEATAPVVNEYRFNPLELCFEPIEFGDV